MATIKRSLVTHSVSVKNKWEIASYAHKLGSFRPNRETSCLASHLNEQFLVR